MIDDLVTLKKYVAEADMLLSKTDKVASNK